MLYRRQKPATIRSSLSARGFSLALLTLSAVTPVVLSNRFIRSSLASESGQSTFHTPQGSKKAEIADHYGKLPLSFESNEGQSDREVKFASHGSGYDLFLTDAEAVLSLRKPRPPADKFKPPDFTEQQRDNIHEATVLRLKVIAANRQSSAEGREQLPGKVNYLVGNDRHKWLVNIPTYRKVYYTDIYPKVDLVYYGNRSELEYDFVVAPGGDVHTIRFQIEGADRMTLDAEGNLRLAVKQSAVTLRRPLIYQLSDKGDRHEVKGEYVIKGKEVRFKVEAFDARKPLVIDPVLSYSTMLGGGNYGYGIAVDSSGNAYITGHDDSGGTPTTPGAFQTGSSLYGNAFVTKLDPTGTNLVYSTHITGSGGATGTAIVVDSAGSAYITGNTKSSDFPTVNAIRSSTSNFYKSVDSGGHWNGQVIGSAGAGAVVTVLSVDPLAPDTMYAGMGLTSGGGILKTTDAGNSWTALNTGVTNVSCAALAVNPVAPTTSYASLVTNGTPGGGLYKSTDGGSSWTILTNGLSAVTVTALAIDPSSANTIYAGASFVGVYKSTNGGASWTNSSTGINYGGTRAIAVDPVTPQNIYLSAGGGGVFKSTNGGANWSQVNNGLTTTTVQTLNIDPSSNVYAGTSGGGLFKTINGGANWTPVNNGISGYIVVSSVALTSSASSTLYLGTQDGRIFKTTDAGSNWTKVYETLTRTSFSAMAINPGTSSAVYAGASVSNAQLNDSEAFVSKLNADGSGLIYSTYLGGNGDDFGYGIAVDSSGDAIVVGQTASASFPKLNASSSTLSGANDAFVTKFNATGDALLYSTYLGGSSMDAAYAVAVDASGSAYVTGNTRSVDFPTLNAFQPTIGDSFDGDVFATKLNSEGALAYSTYLGGEGADIGYGIAVDSSGSAYITGLTTSSSFPLANPIQSTNGGAAGDAFVTKLNSTGSGLIYSTFLGGSSTDGGRGVAIDSAGNAYVTGFTYSADFPVVAGALRTKSPFFKSSDGGGTWNNDNYGLKSDIATVLALDPTKPTTIYAGTRSNVFKSTDGGQSWNSSGNGLVRPNVLALVVDHATPSTVYLCIGYADFGNSSGVYKSTNGGNTWNAANTGLSNTSVLSLAIDPVTPSTLYAGVYGSGIFKSTDGGANWTIQASQTLSFIGAIAIDPITPTTIYAAAMFSPGGVFKTTDGGVTWQRLNNGVPSEYAKSLAIDPVTPSTVYASTGQGIFKSLNSGATWTSISTSLSGPIIIDPVTTTTLYAISASGGGIFKSFDGGNTWTPLNNGLTYRFVSSVIVNPVTPSRIYAGVNVYPPEDDAFVAKINSSGTALIYSTLLGGSPAPGDSLNLNDEGFAISVDSAGNAYVTGETRSPDFPVTPNAFQPFRTAGVFISKLTMSYIISGQVLDVNNTPVSRARVILSDGASLSPFVTEGDGSYQFSHLREGGNFTVSAAKPHFTMTPTSQTFNNLHGNQTVNFTATPTNAPFYSISGHITSNGVALGGVTVTLSGSQQDFATTDSNGFYSFTLAGGGNYTITPTILGFTFAPASQTFNNLSADQTADFAGTRQNFVVTNVNDRGPGSLRQAILNANATVGNDLIVFNIPGSGIQTINLLTGLPEITDPVIIDATTQPGYAGTPLIELNGRQTNASAGFLISAGGSTIRGFVINRFPSGSGIALGSGGNNIIQGNYIGVDSTGTVGRYNYAGISISSSNNLIGGTSSVARNIISGNSFYGVAVSGSGNQIQGNFIGTNASGSAALPNGINGISIGGSPQATNNIVGGTAPGAGNLISGNQRGVDCSSPGTMIQGNLIGTNVTGTAAIGNGVGISSSGANTLIGGTVPGSRNIISGNDLGVMISGTQSRLQGNFIGTDITGMVALGNTGGGADASNHALIGGTIPEARNIISANGGWGNITLGFNDGGGDTATVQGNYIGTDATGRVAFVNPSFGIILFSSNNLIGGTAPGAGNVISGNTVGVQIGGGTTATLTGNLVQGNLIGLNATGDAPLPNRSDGVRLENASNNTIGGEGNAGNTIAFNNKNGVFISSGTGNLILRNSIFSNGGLGIDLFPSGVTRNDPGDGDTGANNLQNFPLLTSVVSSGGTTTIQGTLNSTPSTSFRIDFYSNAACNPSGNGEGARYFGTTNVMTGADGNASINFTTPTALASGRVITATATDPAGNTSEFSPCDSSNATGNVQFSSATFKVLEDVGNAVITVIRAGGSKGTVSVNYKTADGTATAGSDYTAVSGTLVFADGETSKTFTVPVANDGVSEPDETVLLALSASDLETVGNPATATMVIQDNSTPLFLSMNSIDVPEGDNGNTNAVVTVTLSAETGRTVTANYNTVAGTATSGVDFVAASGILTFAPAVTTQGITVSIIGDTINEINETFQVVLSNAIYASINNSSTVRILDDDPPMIASVLTPAGRTSGGQQIRLNGAFARLTRVLMDGLSASWFFTNGSADTTAITVRTPAHGVGAVRIDLIPSSGLGSSKTNAFAYLPTVFTDNTLTAGVTTTKAQHIIEIRQAVDALRAVAGLGPAPWTDPTLSTFSTQIKAVHILELRSFLEDAASRLGYSPGTYTDPGLTTGSVIKRIHVEELRQRIRTIAG